MATPGTPGYAMSLFCLDQYCSLRHVGLAPVCFTPGDTMHVVTSGQFQSRSAGFLVLGLSQRQRDSDLGMRTIKHWPEGSRTTTSAGTTGLDSAGRASIKEELNTRTHCRRRSSSPSSPPSSPTRCLYSKTHTLHFSPSHRISFSAKNPGGDS